MKLRTRCSEVNLCTLAKPVRETQLEKNLHTDNHNRYIFIISNFKEMTLHFTAIDFIAAKTTQTSNYRFHRTVPQLFSKTSMLVMKLHEMLTPYALRK